MKLKVARVCTTSKVFNPVGAEHTAVDGSSIVTSIEVVHPSASVAVTVYVPAANELGSAGQLML